MSSISIDELKALVGKELGPSSWMDIDQARIDSFADVSGDHQFIHIDPERAQATPFGGTIAHGLLTLSLLPAFAQEVLPVVEGAKMNVNYGYNKIRFLNPVRSGKRVRARFRFTDITETQPGRWRQSGDVTVDIEGEQKPSLIAEWITLIYV
jgi:acyl dehydratase